MGAGEQTGNGHSDGVNSTSSPPNTWAGPEPASFDFRPEEQQTNGDANEKMISGHSNGVKTTSTPANDAGSAPGSEAFDFRSDVTTRPTLSMLAAIAKASLGDDVFCDDKDTHDLQEFIAELTSFPAALLVASGTMGNQLSIRTHLGGPPNSIVADARSHIIEWEAGGIASFSGALAIPVTPANGHHLTLADIQAHAVTSTDVHHTPTTLISLENTLAGTILPLSDCQAISSWARSQDPPIRLHVDGARLWEAVAAGAGSLKDYCACFDSVSLCFSKGLGAPIGSMIVGSRLFIARARHIRKGMGGGMRQTGVISAPARLAVEETFLGGKLNAARERAREVAALWEKRGGRLEMPVETNMVWLDLKAAGFTRERFVERAVEQGLKVIGGRLVVHYQISSEALHRLSALFTIILPSPTDKQLPSLPSNNTKAQAREVAAPEVE